MRRILLSFQDFLGQWINIFLTTNIQRAFEIRIMKPT